MTSINVDIWSDIACPWCYIGKRNFDRALELLGADSDPLEVSVRFHSFELSPDTPVDFDGSEVDFLASHKGISADQAEQMLAQVTQTAAAAGLSYRFDLLQHTNTVKAHELIHVALAEGKQAEMVERLMAAYFTEGRHVGTIAELVALAGEVGLDEDQTRSALTDSAQLAAVRNDQRMAQEYGITAVPFFVINDAYGISGAQAPETLVQAFREIAAAAQPPQ